MKATMLRKGKWVGFVGRVVLFLSVATSVVGLPDSCRYISFVSLRQKRKREFHIVGAFSLKTCINLCCPEGEVFRYVDKQHRFNFSIFYFFPFSILSFLILLNMWTSSTDLIFLIFIFFSFFMFSF